MIKSVEELKEFFIRSKNPNDDAIAVGTKIRCDWMLNQDTVVVKGTVRRVQFENQYGGVWLAKLAPK